MDSLKLWEGPFGDLYQERNEPTSEEVDNRMKFLQHILQTIYTGCGILPSSVLEIGAGQGPNLMALEKLSMQIGKPLKLYATEINQRARVKLSENAKTVEILDKIPNIVTADLVMTYGVLIHTHPALIRELQTKIHNAANRWILCCEYFSPVTRPITYRGEKDALWLDDYGSIWLNNFSLSIVGYGFAWKKVTGLDNITFWLFEKVGKMI